MQLLVEITEREDLMLKDFKSLAGGDINRVFCVQTSTEKYVIKLNNKSAFPNMFKEEALALKALAETKTFKIPKVICTGEYEDQAYLIMEYMEAGKENEKFWKDFGIDLANLHRNTNEKFGWQSQNYIGSLPQYNQYCSTSAEFYVTQRLEPQFKLASKKGYTLKGTDAMLKKVVEIIPKDEKPALIHGDLWSGNYMISTAQKPVLIDPAIAYASREMDLAMMQLFGGFPPKVFEVYQAHFPLPADWKSRIELYQLYYLLVHLNLFGKAYFNSVQRIIQKYT